MKSYIISTIKDKNTMKLKNPSLFKRYNIIAWETDALYHKISLSFSLTDSALNILYIIYYSGKSAELREIVQYSGLQKQTVNSALRNLEEKGIITLESVNRKSKSASLTPKGTALCEKSVKKLIEWEDSALASFSESELSLFLSLMEKYLLSLKKSLEGYIEGEEKE